jgi:membrane protein DedA with SNARE-associated domain
MCEHRRVLRAASVLKPVLVVAIAVHLHHHFHGPALDYLGLAAACAAGWAGLPGPGEPVLIAEAIFAARHDLDIVSVVVAAWLAATAGGMIGWAVGWKAGRAVVTAPGPMRRMRLRVVERGEAAFARHPVLAITLTPAFVAGIHRVRPSVYTAINTVSAAIWAAGIGLGAYYTGPAVLDAVNDEGLFATGALVVLVIASVVVGSRRRHARSGSS